MEYLPTWTVKNGYIQGVMYVNIPVYMDPMYMDQEGLAPWAMVI